MRDDHYSDVRNLTAIEDELEEVRERLALAEQDGQEIAMRAESRIAELTYENERLREAGIHDAYCRGCEGKRRILAFIAGIPMGFAGVAFASKGSVVEQIFLGTIAAVIPTLVVVMCWHWRHFKRNSHWISFTDNDLSRALQAAWDAFWNN